MNYKQLYEEQKKIAERLARGIILLNSNELLEESDIQNLSATLRLARKILKCQTYEKEN